MKDPLTVIAMIFCVIALCLSLWLRDSMAAAGWFVALARTLEVMFTNPTK